MEFYSERNGHIDTSEIKVSIKKLNILFVDTFIYFYKKGYFRMAFEGHENKSPLMIPSPKAYFFEHLGSFEFYPIDENGWKYNKHTLFTVIEMLYLNIRKPDMFGTYVKDEAQEQFRDTINKYLKCYEDGYEITEKGWISILPEDGLRELIRKDLPEETEDEVTIQIETSIKMFFNYSSNNEMKKKAINILVDVLEPLRDVVKELVGEIVDGKKIKKQPHDAMIFGIVNAYRIRHNDVNQKDEYDKGIWYEWMFHYYLATIHAVLRLKKK
ncbi:hypothetical protein KPL47_09830 [Clostridium estertheticum]|uniref:hypothetical protein n=1 Tax=Clostridium estertheticum TaxID=238834 RepID=UPI001C0C2D49|nr:hypothetical protein [Clostridium estertheticum]MBU3176671.1 hypothetical protein [Clostridium estertheticum]